MKIGWRRIAKKGENAVKMFPATAASQLRCRRGCSNRPPLSSTGLGAGEMFRASTNPEPTSTGELCPSQTKALGLHENPRNSMGGPPVFLCFLFFGQNLPLAFFLAQCSTPPPRVGGLNTPKHSCAVVVAPEELLCMHPRAKLSYLFLCIFSFCHDFLSFIYFLYLPLFSFI